MPSEISTPLARFLAKWQLGFILPEDVPAAATELLLAGAEGEALATLAGLMRPSRLEVGPLIQQVRLERSLEEPTETQARWVLVRAGLEAIKAGTLSPHRGAAQIAALCRDLGMPDLLTYFVYLSADYDPRNTRFDDQIRSTAADVLSSLDASRSVAT